MSCQYRVKPFPKEYCVGCALNGCYPWNRNPVLLCSEMGGLFPALTVRDDSNLPIQCLSFKLITEELWKSHLEDLKREAEWNEDMRLRAMKGEVFNSELLPAEYLEELRRKRNGLAGTV